MSVVLLLGVYESVARAPPGITAERIVCVLRLSVLTVWGRSGVFPPGGMCG